MTLQVYQILRNLNRNHPKIAEELVADLGMMPNVQTLTTAVSVSLNSSSRTIMITQLENLKKSKTLPEGHTDKKKAQEKIDKVYQASREIENRWIKRFKKYHFATARCPCRYQGVTPDG